MHFSCPWRLRIGATLVFPRAGVAVEGATQGTPQFVVEAMLIDLELPKYAAHIANACAPVCKT